MRTYMQDWDVRCPQKAIEMFDRSKPYYWKINRKQAVELCEILAEAYEVKPPNKIIHFSKNGKSRFFNSVACYFWDTRTIVMHPRNHIKTIVHEFYHHLDYITSNLYNSSDELGYSYKFAELWWQKFQQLK